MAKLNQKSIDKKLRRMVAIQKKLDAVKKLYKELDDLTIELVVNQVFGGTVGPYHITITDNFCDKNTCFKATAVKRYEAKVAKRAK